MTIYYLKIPSDTLTRRVRKKKSRTMLQSIATQCNWLIWFMCKDIHLGAAKELVLSHKTIKLQCEVNEKMKELRLSIKIDWEVQRKKLTGLTAHFNHSRNTDIID